MSTTDSDDPDQYESDLQSQSTPQPVGPNKVQELVEDNKSLRSTMRRTAQSLAEKYSQMMDFYQRLKESSRRISQAYLGSQHEVAQQKKTIALLKAENFQLRMEGLKIKGPAVGKGEENDKLKVEYQDTITDLLTQLRKAEEDAKLQQQYYSEMWEKRDQQYREQIESWKLSIQRELSVRINDSQAEQELMQRKMRQHEEKEQVYQNQVKSLIMEINDYKKQFEIFESRVSSLKSKLQATETRVYETSVESKKYEDKVKEKEDENLQLKRSLEETRLRRNEKEESLEQLFEVYNKEREKVERLEAKLLRSGNQSEELDKVYAQYLCAEESLKRKNEDIANLKKILENQGSSSGTDIAVYKQQAEIYKKDFEMEREARQKLHQECENLKTMVGQYQIEMQRMKQDLMRYHHEVTKNR